MPLGSAVTGLLSGIETAYNNAVENGAKEDNATSTQEFLGADMGEAIDQYYIQALVSTSVTIDSGQMDAVGGSTQVDGTGTGTGSLDYLKLAELKGELERAYSTAASTGKTGDPIPQLAQDVSDAIHKYMISGTVITSIIADGGQVTNAAAGTANPVGTVTTPGTGMGEGSIRFDDTDVGTLKTDIETAYENAKKNGESGASLEQLAQDMQAAIHRFALTAIVETGVTVLPGQVVAGYMVLAGTAPVPLPAVTLITTAASGEGELS